MEAGKLLQESSQLGRVSLVTHRARFQIMRIFFSFMVIGLTQAVVLK